MRTLAPPPPPPSPRLRWEAAPRTEPQQQAPQTGPRRAPGVLGRPPVSQESPGARPKSSAPPPFGRHVVPPHRLGRNGVVVS